MSTPIYDAMLAEQARTWTPAETTIGDYITSRQKNWRTFTRCLGWWKR